jgi:glycerol-3-phosphate acyltransferase PlsY
LRAAFVILSCRARQYVASLVVLLGHNRPLHLPAQTGRPITTITGISMQFTPCACAIALAFSACGHALAQTS